MNTPLILTIAAIIVGVFIIYQIARAIWEHYVQTITIWAYQVGLHFRHGQLLGELGAGRHRLWGDGHQVVVYDTRVSELVVASQELITADSATLKATAVAQWRIADAAKFHDAADDAKQALYTHIQLAIRQVIGALDLDAVLENKTDFGAAISQLVRDGAADLGFDLQRADVRDPMLGGDLKGVYASVLTARKEAQAKQETARGEAAVLRTLANAARAFENNPERFRLRYLEMLKAAGTSGFGNQLVIGVAEELMGLVKKD